MRKSFVLVAFVAAAALAAGPARAADDLSTIGVGPHGFDFLIGQTIHCRNTMPGPVSGPAVSTTVVSAGSAPGRMTFRSGPSGPTGYNTYVSSQKTWVGPFASPDGSYGSEKMMSVGAHSTWAGTYTDAAGHTVKLRDTFTNTSFLMNTDVTETNDGSGWKVVGKTTCVGTKG